MPFAFTCARANSLSLMLGAAAECSALPAGSWRASVSVRSWVYSGSTTERPTPEPGQRSEEARTN